MIHRRTLEIATAALTGAFGAAIMASSLRSGVGWTPRGVDSGTFPFIAGVLVVAGSLYNAARALPFEGPILLEGPGILKLAAMLLPAVLFVAAIPFIGLHVAAAAYVFGMVAFHGKGGMRKAAALAVATPLSLYGIFDWGFQVPLPRGMLGAALGF